MIVSIAFIGATVLIEAWPIYFLAMRGLNRGRSTVPELWVLAPSLLGVLALTLAAVIAPIRLGLKSLERLKD
jgi:hypothetical protein